jgi:protein O-GlcNAc transferase
MSPARIQAAFQQALNLHQSGRQAEAEAAYQQILRDSPNDFPSHCMLGRLRIEQGRLDEAVSILEAAIRINEQAPQGHGFYGVARLRQRRFDEAAKAFQRAIAIMPDDAVAHRNLGDALRGQGEAAAAVEAYSQALALNPGAPDILARRADALLSLGQIERAVEDLGGSLRRDSRNIDVLMLLGDSLAKLRRWRQAVEAYDAALAVDSSRPGLLFKRGLALDEMGALEAAIESYSGALAAHPDDIASLNNRSAALSRLGRYEEARTGLERILALEPDHIYAFGGLALCELNACSWARRDWIEAELRERVLAGKVEIPPGTLLSYLDDPALQLICAGNYARFNLPACVAYDGPGARHDRIRVAYLSADFHDHATARLAAALFEHHDRARFEVYGLSFGVDDGSAMRRRLKAAFEHFHDVAAWSDVQIIDLMRKLEIDIAVDLKGYTQDARPQLFGRRPAPLQVNYLGFPGSLGGNAYDYVLGDAVVTPMSHAQHFAEKIVQLPGAYQPNDPMRPVPHTAMSRREAGLPEEGVVFCSFNNNYKITPEVFDVWMRLLKTVDGSVLWLLEDNAEARNNLRREAGARDIDPQRLVFAPRVPPAEHLARHSLADLMLDTLPYGAHTTASDALWMGVPVVTCLGRAFAGRVCASLCWAVGLRELVADDLGTYEAIALDLAHNPERLERIKARLREQRQSLPLFDAHETCRGIEVAFETMMQLHRDGRPPEAFVVALD